jgi:YD repeat-containing protein
VWSIDAYKHNHQLKHISQTGTGVVATEIDFSYDKLSQLQQIDRTSASDPIHVITKYQYNTAGLLADINNYFQTTNTNTTTNISHYHYTYDPGNRPILTTGTDGNKAVDYSNDNQINTVTTSTGNNEAYQFDTLGNRSTWSTDPLDSRRLLNDGTYQYLYGHINRMVPHNLPRLIASSAI